MAMPCNPALRPQSVWIVFSAPEITTVSKPKRNPARAEVSDQKKMRPFISGRRECYQTVLRLIRDPACTIRQEGKPRTEKLNLRLGQRISLFPPVANPAVHRDHLGVAHLLQIIGGKRRSEASAAIKYHLRIQIRYARLNVTFDDAFAQVNRAWQVVLGEFALFSHVHQQKCITAVDSPLHFFGIRLANPRFGVVHNFQKPRRMLVSHKFLLLVRVATLSYQADDVRGPRSRSSVPLSVFSVSMIRCRRVDQPGTSAWPGPCQSLAIVLVRLQPS